MSDPAPSTQLCAACGAQNLTTAKWCFQCHSAFAPTQQPLAAQQSQAPQVVPPPAYSQPAFQQPPPQFQPPPVPTGPQEAPGATPALIFGIISCVAWIACGVPGLIGIAGVIFGISARKKISESHGVLAGEGKATTGIALGIVGIVIALIYVGFMYPRLTDRDASPTNISSDQAAKSYPFTVRDGAFQFEIESVECSVSFCDASMNVTKISGTAEEDTFFASNQKLIDSNGVKSEGTITGGTGERSIAKGTITPIVVTFAVTGGATARSIELHDSMFSDGVTVRLPAS